MSQPLPERSGPVRDFVAARFEDSLIALIAEAAGIEPRDLLRDALTPPTLAEIAESYGVDVVAVLDTAEAQITDEVNQAVADGKITEEQAAEVLDGLRARLEDRLDDPLGAQLFEQMRDRFSPGEGRRFPRQGGAGDGGDGVLPLT